MEFITIKTGSNLYISKYDLSLLTDLRRKKAQDSINRHRESI